MALFVSAANGQISGVNQSFQDTQVDYDCEFLFEDLAQIDPAPLSPIDMKQPFAMNGRSILHFGPFGSNLWAMSAGTPSALGF